MQSIRPHHLLIPLLATVAVLPMLMHGCSCGHDMGFHVQSWLEAAEQLLHGHYPHWAFSPAWQAGEPRFIFYPPLSWMLGAALIKGFPADWTPVVFTWIVLVCAGFSMHRVAREFVAPETALLSAAVYIANPYMMFNAFERAAYAELMAAIWVPLILLAVLRARPTVLGLAIPLGLIWLTNAPSGVMASYAIVLLAVVRLIAMLLTSKRSEASGNSLREPARLAVVFAGGIVVGLSLVAYYLIPAAYQRRFVQVDMAIIPNLRFQDNFLFSRTAYEPHNVVTHTVSLIGLTLLIVTLSAVFGTLLRTSRADPSNSGSLPRESTMALTALAVVIGFLMLPASSFVWAHLPNMKFMQFPWRLLTILSAVLAVALGPLTQPWARSRKFVWPLAFAIVLGLSQLGGHLYRQRCEADELPSFDKRAFETGHGLPATDEYTPLNADNDLDRTDNPGYWLLTGSVNAYAPGTIQNPNEVNTNYDAPMPFENTVAARAPQHLDLTLAHPETVVFNLRDYPAWRVTRNGIELPPHLQRDDGLLALALPAGASTIDIHWRRTLDQTIGMGLSGYALIVVCVMWWRSRKIKAA